MSGISLFFKKSWKVTAAATAAAAKSLQLCPTLCDPRDSSQQKLIDTYT